MCSFPDWPRSDEAWHVKFAGLSGYHGHLAWSWLMGLALKVALLQRDEAMVKLQLSTIAKVLQRDQEVLEIYDPRNDLKGWGSLILNAERPFSWGAAYFIDALHTILHQGEL